MKRRIASLPMYVLPETIDDHDRYWSLIRHHLGNEGLDAPEKLDPTEFTRPEASLDELYFTQICGLPYRRYLADHVTLIGTPDYGVFGSKPGYYRSAIVARRDERRNRIDEFDGAVLAYNNKLSQSGYAAPSGIARNHGITFGGQVHSGSHRQSMRLVASGQADIAAIDAVSLDMIARIRSDPDPGRLRVVSWSEPTPGLPYVTWKNADPDPFFRAVRSAIRDLSVESRCRLRLFDLVPIPSSEYHSVTP